MKKIIYSTNTKNVEIINSFFSGLDYTPLYHKKTAPAADGDGRVIKFTIPKFNPLKLEGKVLEEWRNLPLAVSRVY